MTGTQTTVAQALTAVKAGDKPLAGMRITDFTLHAAGPFATHFLSLLGAEPIKIESMQRLDIHRRPHPVYGRFDIPNFDQGNAGKLGITLNLKDPRGRQLAIDLAKVSGMVAENFRPGVMHRLGLDYDTLKAEIPDLIMLSVSNSGQFGPDSSTPGYAPIFSALGGLGWLTGYSDGPPTELRNMMDNVTGLNGAFAALVALDLRRRTGVGSHVDVSAREVASCFAGDAILAASVGVQVSRRGNGVGTYAPYNVYPTAGKDKWISIAVTNAAQWRGLIGVLGLEQFAAAPELDDASVRWARHEELDAAVAAATRDREAFALTQELQAHGVPAFPSVNAEEIVNNEHLRERDAILDLNRGDGSRAVAGPLWRFSRSRASLDRWSPELGEHNQYVFGEILGLPTREIADLVDAGVIA